MTVIHVKCADGFHWEKKLCYVDACKRKKMVGDGL